MRSYSRSRWWSRSPVPSRARTLPRRRPCLEVLEDRSLPSTFNVVLATDAGGPTGQRVSATSGDLRYCIEQADGSSATSNVINFSSSVFGSPQTITLNSATGPLMVSVSNPLTINGPTTDTVSVSGGGATQVFHVTGSTVTIKNLRVTQGFNTATVSPADLGGGIFSSDTLTLNNCTLDHDIAPVGGGLANYGGTVKLVGCTFNFDSANSGAGAIYDDGSLTATNSNISNDTGGGTGGGAVIVNGSVSMTNCTLSNDTDFSEDGGGIFILASSTGTFSKCTFSNDFAPNAGGGVCTDESGTITFSNCTFSNDSAGQGSGLAIPAGNTVTLNTCTFSNDNNDALLDEGTVVATNCTFSNDPSNGFANNIGNPGTGVATLTGCTFSNDSGAEGGGLENNGTATVTNCTFANNTCTSNRGGGGIWNGPSGMLTLTNCTLAYNSAPNGPGGGIVNNSGGSLTLTNTIVAENTASSGPDVAGTINNADHNLIGDGTGATIVTDQGGNMVGGNGNPVIDPGLGPLANNGGPTQTLALQRGSVAIGHADDSQAPATDQRGHSRTDHFGLATDIGAYEYP